MSEEICAGVVVSRETMQRLEEYVQLLKKWNPAINLVAKSTINDVWARHIVDSAQVFNYAPENPTLWTDFGSGGGFPALVCAVLAKERDHSTEFVLVESDQRKCEFLRTVIRNLSLNARVMSARVEELDPLSADVVTARALGSLSMLLSCAERHMQPTGVALFLKGQNYAEEVAESLANWRYILEEFDSETNQDAKILRLREIERV